MSVLTGTLAGDEVVLDAGGRVPIGRRLRDAPNGTRVRVGLRPEGAEVRRGEGDAPATVVTAMVLGERLQLVVRCGDGQEVLLRQGRSADDAELAAAGPGERIGIAFRPRCGLLIGTDAEDGAPQVDTTLEGAVR
jgi:hypothetical protein